MEKFITIKRNKFFLAGVIHKPESRDIKKFPCVILCHGFSGNKSESHFIFTRLARLLESSGIVCLRFDFMGSGDSSGYFEDMTLSTEIQDAESAYRFIAGQSFIDREKIGILGLSMGCVPATAVASKYQLKSLCLWSPVAYPQVISKKILTRKLSRILEREKIVYIPGSGLRISKHFIDSLSTIDIIDMATNFNGNVLIIHSKDDAVIDISHAFSYYTAFHASTRTRNMIVVEKGSHTFTTQDAEEIVLGETVRFFKKTLPT